MASHDPIAVPPLARSREAARLASSRVASEHGTSWPVGG